MTAEVVGNAARRRNIFIVANNIEEVGGLQRVVHNLRSCSRRRGTTFS